MLKVFCGKSFLLTIAIPLACCAYAEHRHQFDDENSRTQAPTQGSAPQFKAMAGAPEGTREATIFTLGLPRVHSRLEIRTVVVPAGKPVTLVAENEGVFEIRTGSASDLSEGKTRKLQRGEVWHVSKGEHVTLQAAEELAVVRAIYLMPGEN